MLSNALPEPVDAAQTCAPLPFSAPAQEREGAESLVVRLLIVGLGIYLFFAIASLRCVYGVSAALRALGRMFWGP